MHVVEWAVPTGLAMPMPLRDPGASVLDTAATSSDVGAAAIHARRRDRMATAKKATATIAPVATE